jgi:hypothetical protein
VQGETPVAAHLANVEQPEIVAELLTTFYGTGSGPAG